MLRIRPDQADAFRRERLRRFVDGLLEHTQEYFPNHWRVIGPEQLREVCNLGIRRAASHGLTTEREVYLYVSLMLYLGSYFDSDQQLPWAAETLEDDGFPSPFARIEATFDRALSYMDEVYGARNEHLTRAVEKLSAGPAKHLAKLPASRGDMSAALDWVFPQKCEALGEDRLSSLVEQGIAKAKDHDIATRRGATLLTGLMFMLGHGIDRDPQFPWVGENLADPTLATPDKRVDRLHREATAQLELWLA